MKLTKKQLNSLVKLVADADNDDGDCGSCFDHLAEFAETKLEGKEIPEALRVVQVHIDQCPCCRVELDALMEGLRGMEE